MKKSIFKVIPILAISGSVLFAQYDAYNYQNYQDSYNNNQQQSYQDNYNNQQQNNYNNNYNAQNNTANNSYYNYYEEFMKTLAEQAKDPNSVYYSPTFSQQYNNYSQNQNHSNPYQEAMNAMNAASDNYNNQNNQSQGYNNNYNDTYNTQNNNAFVNPYEELIKMLETESQNPNSPYYSPNGTVPANQNNNYQQDYNTYDQASAGTENPYELAAQELIKAAEELSKKANNNNSTPAPLDNYNTPNYSENNYNNTVPQDNNYNNNNNYNFYAPFQIPQAVLDTAKRTYPNAQIWKIDMEYIDIYEVKMSNMMELYIDKNGKLLYQQFDD